MPHLKRAVYAFFVSVIAVGVLMVLEMIFQIGIGDFVFSAKFFVPMFVVAYLATPFLTRRITFH